MVRNIYHVNQGFEPDLVDYHSHRQSNGAEAVQMEVMPDQKSANSYDIDDHQVPIENLAKRYCTDLDKGLNRGQADRNREIYGPNILTPPPKPSKVFEFFKCVFFGLNSLLWACSILSFGSWASQYIYAQNISNDNLILACALVVVVHVSGSFEFYQQFKSDRIMESFKNMVPHFAVVIREGKRQQIAVDDLVVGDIVEVKYGDTIGADLRLIECSNFKVDNSSLTGESEPQKRYPQCTDPSPLETKNLAFFSTSAMEGHAKGLVIRTGTSTFMGRLASLTSTVNAGDSPIQKEMSRFIIIMSIRSILFGGTFFVVALFMRYSMIEVIFFVIGILVANVPEGLTVSYTMVLALTAKRMAKKNCLVKNIQAVEALGSTSVICSDKTGTLTQNRMSVAHVWINNQIIEADTNEVSVTTITSTTNNPIKPSSHLQLQQQQLANENGFDALANIGCLCSKAIFKPEDEKLPILLRRVDGDPSEAAILKFMEKESREVIKYRKEHPKLMEIPFNSRNKYQLSIHDMNDPMDDRYLAVMKGAPERIAGFCTHILIGNKTFEFDSRWKKEFNEVYTALGSLGERVFGFCDAYLPLEKYPRGCEFDSESNEYLEIGYRFVGMIGMLDPPRPAVPDAVLKCKAAGIKVIMITGDHAVTAKAIARSVNILSEGNLTIEELAMNRGCSVDEIDPKEADAAVVTGAELNLLTSEQLSNVLVNHKEIVFARTSPEQKYLIVDALQNMGSVVACTGDGVNDSPALKKADVGIAMGITGSEISKESADMILMDDNFSTIITGIEEGRLIFDNIKKLICYNLSDNIAEMYSVWSFIILSCPLPMGTIGMLLSVLGTDVLPAISIAHEKAEADIMKLKPRNPATDKLVTPQLLSYTYGQTSIIELCAGLFTFFVTMGYNGFLPSKLVGIGSAWGNLAINDLEDSYKQEWTYAARQQLGLTAQTSFFAAIVLTQVSNVIICKTRRLSIFQKGMSNWLMNFAIVFELLLFIMFVYTPGLNSALNLAALPYECFIPPLPFSLFMIVYDEFRRLAIRSSKKDSWIHNEFYT